MLRKYRVLFLALFFSQLAVAHSDSVQGKLTPLRTCFEVKHYDIVVQVIPAKKYITGSNAITFQATADFRELQLDLAATMQIDSIVFRQHRVTYQRNKNAVVVQTGKVAKSEVASLRVYFSGHPHVAEQAPWKGGFVWAKDKENNDWVGLACESTGASLWLPCKDHWSDEADSMDLHLSVPAALTGVSNGRLLDVSREKEYTAYHWRVNNTINNYSISINIGKYAVINDTFYGQKPLPLTYYVLEYNKEKAQQHFEQVKGMLACYEQFFGPYPFYDDGYKLVETPYWGMEHQSCIAYGNNYVNNSYGFDFIIIHESGHEWFANSITASDPADMWIHESFTTYAEAIYVECTAGKEQALRYLQSQKGNIKNKAPMQGPRDVFFHDRTDSDIYYKGTWMLHTMRQVLDNDSLWFAALYRFSTSYAHRIIATEEVTAFFNSATGYNWDTFFRQYLYTAAIPELHYQVLPAGDGKLRLRYRWKNTVKDFTMPVKIAAGLVILPTTTWQEVVVPAASVTIPTDLYLINAVEDRQ